MNMAHKRKNNKTLTALLVQSPIALLFLMVGCGNIGYAGLNKLHEANNDKVNGLVLTREVIIKDKSGLVPEPRAMSKSADGGVVVAGRLGRAWAMKTDVKGELVWRYLQDQPLSNGGYTTGFTGALAMKDGSTFLCGNTSLDVKGFTPAILTHLDPFGSLIKEQLVIPQSGSATGLSYFESCSRWGDNLIMVGHIKLYNETRKGDRFYWIVMLNPNGKVIWEKQLPTTFDRIDGTDSILLEPSKSMVLAGYRSGLTEYFRISETGELISHKEPSKDEFRLVQAVVPDGILQHYRFNQADQLYELVTFNERFDEIRRVRGGDNLNFGGRFVYRMQDNSLVLVGGVRHTRGKLSAGHVDAKLQTVQKVGLYVDSNDYYSNPMHVAAVAGKAGEFVVIKQLYKHRPDEGLRGGEHIGLVMYFLQMKLP